MIHLEDGPAHYQPCPRCGRHTLTAWCAGVKTRFNPEPLTIHQEIAALLTGRRTYDVLILGLPRRMYPEWRHLLRIQAPRKHPVIVTHACPPGAIRPQFRQPEIEIEIPSPATEHEQLLF
jgi:hypothetical protein